MIQQPLFQKEVEEYVNLNADVLIKEYIQRHKFNIENLRRGKDTCPYCKRPMRAYCKSLDDRLVKLAWDILIWKSKHKCKLFNPREVWGDDHQKINDFQKLSYWKIIVRTKQAGQWGLTRKGLQFLRGDIQLPRRVWVFNHKVILEEDEMTMVDNPDPRWQQYRSDYTSDFVPLKQTQL